MARMSDWQREAREAREAVKRELWALRGMNAVVKVVPAGGPPLPAQGGFITVGSFLVGKTPAEIVAALGLNAKEYVSGARIYRFARLPQVSEYEYELTAEFPGGLAYSASSDSSFPPGSRKVHQWKIKAGIQIPVHQTDFLDLKPGQPFPRSWL